MLLNRDSPSTRLIPIMGGSPKEVFPTWDQPVEWLEDGGACPMDWSTSCMLHHKYTELSFARLKGAESADQEQVA